MRHAAIAQLDRVTDYESVGRGFESLLPYQKEKHHPIGWCFSFSCWKGLEPSKSELPVAVQSRRLDGVKP